ncbi:hypothetical protein HY993_02285 [Candidatus Micrarchaeota archaeon]|nr:hypothetical protein [Candidatus Micrarchaeota archaeon]
MAQPDLENQLIEKTKWGKGGLEQKILEKQNQFAGLLTREGALAALCAENGLATAQKREITFSPLSSINAVGGQATCKVRLLHVFSQKNFESKGRKGKLANCTISDGIKQANLTLWGKDVSLVAKKPRNSMIVFEDLLVKNINPLDLSSTLLTRTIDAEDDAKIARNAIPMLSLDKVTDQTEFDFIARIVAVTESNQFEKSGKTGLVKKFVAQDQTAQLRVVCWDSNAEHLERVKVGDLVVVESAYAKQNSDGQVEAHLGWKGRFLSNPVIENSLPTREELLKQSFQLAQLKQLQRDVVARVRVCVKSLSEAKYSVKCKECAFRQDNLEGGECPTCQSANLAKLLVVKAILDDGESTCLGVFFSQNALDLLEVKTATINPQTILELKKDSLVGKQLELVVKPQVNLSTGEIEAIVQYIL